MELESLANELLLELFEFFSAIHLLRAFHGLNSRFDTLLDFHFRAYHLDFRRLSKRDFDMFCRQQLPSIIDRAVSICLSDDDETPNQSDHFLSYGLMANIFSQLRSLALYDLRSVDTILNLVSDCRYLSYLTQLKVTECRFRVQKELLRFINTIWHLPTLTNCHFDDILEPAIHLIGPKVTSTSIEYLSITNVECQFGELVHFLEKTPRLRRFCVSVVSSDDDERLQVATSSVTTLKLSFRHSIGKMKNLLQNIHNLHHLTLDTTDMYLNGHEWKQIIVDHLPNIRTFRFRMLFSFPENDNTEKQVDLLLDTFRTPFWLDEHRWFIRCDWNTHTTSNISLYTVPYAFDVLTIHLSMRSKWTCPDDSKYWSYNRIHQLWYQNELFQDLTVFPARFPNIHHLRMRHPANHNFWSVIPTLNHLTSLNLSLRQSRTVTQINALFDQIPRLYSLTIDQSLFSRIATLQFPNTSIRRLNLFELSGSYFDNSKCTILANSALGHKCEVLVIGVEHRTNVYYLINQMPTLRALTFRCRDDKWHDNGSSSARDELLEWLKNRLPSTCSISRNKKAVFQIRIWIG